MSTKRIVAEARFCPNYIFHLLAVAGVGFESDYAQRYSGSVFAADREFVVTHRKLLTFGSGSGGELCDAVIFLPIYFDLEHPEQLGRYYDVLCAALRNDDVSDFMRAYAARLADLERTWVKVNAEDVRSLSVHADALTEIGQIMARNVASYRADIWPSESARMGKIADKVNTYVSKYDLISRWERLTSRPFLFDQYTILLCSAIKNGPNANSIGYDLNVFYSDSDFDWMCQFISHEIGTHLLIRDFRAASEQPGISWKTLYAANESLARYLNCRVLGESEVTYRLDQFHAERFSAIFDSIYSHKPDVDFKWLLLEAVKRFEDSIDK
jgi:hypothetical protein